VVLERLAGDLVTPGVGYSDIAGCREFLLWEKNLAPGAGELGRGKL